MKKREQSPEAKKLKHLTKSLKKSKLRINRNTTRLERKLGAELKEARLEASNEG